MCSSLPFHSEDNQRLKNKGKDGKVFKSDGVKLPRSPRKSAERQAVHRVHKSGISSKGQRSYNLGRRSYNLGLVVHIVGISKIDNRSDINRGFGGNDAMITDIPTPRDFELSGIGFLNLAWDAVISLALRTIDTTPIPDWEYIPEIDEYIQTDIAQDVTEDYWKAAQQPLAMALALTQQGIELLMKGNIANVSPYLLIAGSPREWPGGCQDIDMSFMKFKTVDANELVRMYNTVINPHLTDQFIARFDELRTMRNTIFHSVGGQLRITVEEVLTAIMEANATLTTSGDWITQRRLYLYSNPEAVAARGEDYTGYILGYEMEKAVELLQPAVVLEYLGFNKKQQSYHCYECDCAYNDYGTTHKLVQLTEKSSDCTTVHCLVCGKDRTVTRKDCAHQDCPGNVIDSEDDICLICLKEQFINPF